MLQPTQDTVRPTRSTPHRPSTPPPDRSIRRRRHAARLRRREPVYAAATAGLRARPRPVYAPPPDLAIHRPTMVLSHSRSRRVRYRAHRCGAATGSRSIMRRRPSLRIATAASVYRCGVGRGYWHWDSGWVWARGAWRRRSRWYLFSAPIMREPQQGRHLCRRTLAASRVCLFRLRRESG